MAKPVVSFKYVATEALLPQKLTVGRLYFIGDEQAIVCDHGDGRGPIRYGDKPGPQGIAGEPLPQLQEQIDDLAQAALSTLSNLHYINMKTSQDYSALTDRVSEIASNMAMQDSENANAILSLLLMVNKKFTDYDSAISILGQTISKFYPGSHGGKAGDGSNTITTGEIITANGTAFRVDESYYDDGTGVVVLTVYDTARVNTLKPGDMVRIDSGYFTVDSIQSGPAGGTISLTFYTEDE